MTTATNADYVGIVVVLTLIVVAILAVRVARDVSEADYE